MEPCTITVEPGAGARIQETFVDARAIATLVNWPVLVRGNGVEVEVRPDMGDDDCRVAYETALEQRDAATSGVKTTKMNVYLTLYCAYCGNIAIPERTGDIYEVRCSSCDNPLAMLRIAHERPSRPLRERLSDRVDPNTPYTIAVDGLGDGVVN